MQSAEKLIAATQRSGRFFGMTIVLRGPAINCANMNNSDFSRTAVTAGNCYEISIAGSPPSMFSKTFPRAVPWLAALLASAGAAYWLGRYFITPVEQLCYGLRSLANGQLDVRIAHTTGSKRDEVASLAHDLDVTAARLQELQVARRSSRLWHLHNSAIFLRLIRTHLQPGLLGKGGGRPARCTPRPGSWRPARPSLAEAAEDRCARDIGLSERGTVGRLSLAVQN